MDKRSTGCWFETPLAKLMWCHSTGRRLPKSFSKMLLNVNNKTCNPARKGTTSIEQSYRVVNCSEKCTLFSWYLQGRGGTKHIDNRTIQICRLDLPLSSEKVNSGNFHGCEHANKQFAWLTGILCISSPRDACNHVSCLARYHLANIPHWSLVWNWVMRLKHREFNLTI